MITARGPLDFPARALLALGALWASPLIAQAPDPVAPRPAERSIERITAKAQTSAVALGERFTATLKKARSELRKKPDTASAKEAREELAVFARGFTAQIFAFYDGEQGPKGATRANLAILMAENGGPAAATGLAERLGRDPAHDGELLQALGAIAAWSPTASKRLLTAVSDAQARSSMRAEALRVLAQRGETPALAPALALLGDSLPALRASAYEAVGLLAESDEDAADRILDAFDNEGDPEVRRAALRALGSFPESTPALLVLHKAVAGDTEPEVRAALDALSRAANPRTSRSYLTRCVKREQNAPELREMAAKILARLGDESGALLLAEGHFRRASERSQEATGWSRFADELVRLGANKQAYEMYEKALKRTRSASGKREISVDMARCQARLGKPKMALRILRSSKLSEPFTNLAEDPAFADMVASERYRKHFVGG